MNRLLRLWGAANHNYWPVVVALVLGLAVSITGGILVHQYELGAVNARFEGAAENRIAGILHETDSRAELLGLLASTLGREPALEQSTLAGLQQSLASVFGNEGSTRGFAKNFQWLPASTRIGTACGKPPDVAEAGREQDGSGRIAITQAVCEQNTLRGYLRWSMDARGVIEDGLRTLMPYGIDVAVVDVTRPGSGTLLYFHRSRLSRSVRSHAQSTPFHYERDVRVGDATWRIDCDAVPEMVDSGLSLWPAGVVSVGLVLTIGVALSLAQWMMRAVRVEALVRQRTRELAQARDEAAEASELKSQFLANVSHELRTPLNGILGITELLRDTPLDPQQADWFQMVDRSARHLRDMVNDLLDMSRIETGQFSLHPADFVLRPVIEDATALCTAEALKKNLDLRLAVDPEAPDRLHGDATRLRQVLVNLLSNAVKFTEQGRVHLRVTAMEREGGPVRLAFEVEDTGIGIDPALRERIFQRFAQADGGFSRKHGGLGLGLAITKQIVDRMGGTIRVESVLGIGSRFTVELPLELPVERQAVEPSPREERAPEPRRLLLAEDNLVNQTITSRMLIRLGYQVQMVPNGIEAIRAVEDGSFAAVLMDCQMPEMDGFLATELIRRRESGKRRIPIIALTANAREEDRQRCLTAGMDDYLSKPFGLDQLHETLRRWVAQSEASRGER